PEPPVRSRQVDRPAQTEPARRQRERDRLEVAVEEEHERVVADVLAAGRMLRELLAVQEHADRLRLAAAPVALRHLPPVRPEPPDVRQARAVRRPTGEERAPAEDRMRRPERDQGPCKLDELPVDVLPVEPRDLVVLAERVVVAALRS